MAVGSWIRDELKTTVWIPVSESRIKWFPFPTHYFAIDQDLLVVIPQGDGQMHGTMGSEGWKEVGGRKLEEWG